MSELSHKQRKFTKMLAEFVLWAYEQGYELTYGDAFRDPRLHGKVGEKVGYGHRRSCHKVRLAVDFNLFKDGVFLESTDAHRPLGEEWERRGGTWGGRFDDGNHYSMEYGGMK